jgi:hypothetical protein
MKRSSQAAGMERLRIKTAIANRLMVDEGFQRPGGFQHR